MFLAWSKREWMSEEGGEKITETQVLQNGHDIEKSALNAESG